MRIGFVARMGAAQPGTHHQSKKKKTARPRVSLLFTRAYGCLRLHPVWLTPHSLPSHIRTAPDVSRTVMQNPK